MRRLLALSFAFVLEACSHGVGTPCEVNADCDAPLVCALAPDTTPDQGATCQPNVAPATDIGAPHDSSNEPSDAGPMDGSATHTADASSVDAAVAPDLSLID